MRRPDGLKAPRHILVWVPLALYWRRRRKRLAAVPAVRSAAPANITSFAQFHLHFGALTTTRESWRSTVTRDSKTVRTTMWRTGNPACPDRRDRLSSTVHSTSRVFRTISSAATTKTVHFNSRVAHSRDATTLLHHTDRRVRSLVESIRRITSSKSEHTHAIERHTTLRSSESRVFRRSSSSTHVHSHRESTVVSQRWSRQASELVWRRAPRAQTESSDVAPAPAVFPRRVTAQETAPEAHRTATRAALKAADFDPGLLDRLTDDVIRRVERRARIERERRGL
ncbi:MAG TPA: hypothetical protein VM733_23165 [Thermoanaerobaculia bacterium]|nr:hypothetical protein [Thermoanaerobaculia bacterium]